MISRRENLLVRPWQLRRFSYHRKKVLSAHPAIDSAPPPFREHVSNKLKKTQVDSERRAKIVEDNFTLLQHLMKIRSTSRVDHFWTTPPPNFLSKVGIYGSRSPKIEKTEVERKPVFLKTRKDKCPGCSPHLNPIKENLTAERLPYDPPKKQMSTRLETINPKESTYKSYTDEDIPNFRGQQFGTPRPKKSASNRKQKSLPSVGSPSNIVLAKGGLTVSVKFPLQEDIDNDGAELKLIEREFCEYTIKKDRGSRK